MELGDLEHAIIGRRSRPVDLPVETMRSQFERGGVGVNGFTYAWNHEQPRNHFVSLSWSRESGILRRTHA